MSDVFPSPCFSPHCALLGYTVNTGSRNSEGVTWPHRRHTQQYTTLCSLACQTPAFIGETEGSSASSVRVSVHPLVATEFKAARNGEFTTSSQSVIEVGYRRVTSMSWEDCFCEEKIYMEYLECKTVIVCVEIRCWETTSRDLESWCACNGEL
jgi:hypothetical protein